MPRQVSLLAATVALVMVTAGCIGGPLASADADSDATPTTWEKPAPPATCSDGNSDNSTPADEIISQIEEDQQTIKGFQATIDRKTAIELTNGSTINRTTTQQLAVDYAHTPVRVRQEAIPTSGEKWDLELWNESNHIQYNSDEHRYWFKPRDDGPHRFGSHYSQNDMAWAGTFTVLQRENAATYCGVETVNGRDAYVLHFSAKPHPNGPTSTPTAYFVTQTFWFHKESGLLLKHVAHKPVRRFNHSVSEYSNSEEREEGGIRDDDGDTIYLDDKTRTLRLRNVSINPTWNGTFQFNLPEEAKPVGAS